MSIPTPSKGERALLVTLIFCGLGTSVLCAALLVALDIFRVRWGEFGFALLIVVGAALCVGGAIQYRLSRKKSALDTEAPPPRPAPSAPVARAEVQDPASSSFQV